MFKNKWYLLEKYLPKPIYRSVFSLKLIYEATSLRRKVERESELYEKVRVVRNARFFSSNQKQMEIFELLTIIKRYKPRNILEIGSANGGNLLLFSQVLELGSKILSIDKNYPSDELRKSLKFLVSSKYCFYPYQGDSHSTKVFNFARDWFKGEGIDFLFIDGDHSEEGVFMDYKLFSKLLSKRGIIAFHDIVPDHYQRFSIKTEGYSGGVPIFWEKIKRKNINTLEFIENVDQDGCGIGVIFPERNRLDGNFLDNVR